MDYIKVKDGQIVDDSEEGVLLPIISYAPDIDSSYQILSAPQYTVLADCVEARYEVHNCTGLYTKFVEERLADFAKQKDIDITEIAMLLNCSNQEWQNEAAHFSDMYVQTWEAFYNSTDEDWKDIEASLPVLSWDF